MESTWAEGLASTTQSWVSYRVIPVDDTCHEDVDALGDKIRNLIQGLTSWNTDVPQTTVGVLKQRYIWQHECMTIQQSLAKDKGSSGKQNEDDQCDDDRMLKGVLEGRLRFGDNMDDEWFVVWLLREISIAFPVAIQVWDDDGEFLLIEAAYSLPTWLEPDVATNRIWLYRGHVHCIPPDSTMTKTIQNIDMKTGKDFLLQHVEAARQCGESIDAAIAKKIDVYPGYAQETMHRATVCVPCSIVGMLVENPQSIAVAVEKYSSSTPNERRQASKFCRYLQEDDKLVPYIATFNRCLYSKLRLCSYQAPKSSPWHAYSEAFKHEMMKHSSDNVDVALDLGIKLLLGFEISNIAPDLPVSPRQRLECHIAKDCSYIESETWLYQASGRLESELEVRESELGGFDPEELSQRMKGFLSTVSDTQGAAIQDEEISFDPEVFFKTLAGTWVSSSEDEGSSFYEMSGSSSDVDDEISTEYPVVLTETDSDDEDFKGAYEEALARELEETCLDDSFIRKENDDDPVDLDLNLVSNLLSSHAEQGPTAGPVSSLAGLLGVSLPRHDDTKEEGTFDDTIQ